MSNGSYSSKSSSSSELYLDQHKTNAQQRHKGNCCCQACINKYKYLAATTDSDLNNSISNCKSNHDDFKSNICKETAVSSFGKFISKRKVLSVDLLAENLAKKKLKLDYEENLLEYSKKKSDYEPEKTELGKHNSDKLKNESKSTSLIEENTKQSFDDHTKQKKIMKFSIDPIDLTIDKKVLKSPNQANLRELTDDSISDSFHNQKNPKVGFEAESLCILHLLNKQNMVPSSFDGSLQPSTNCSSLSGASSSYLSHITQNSSAFNNSSILAAVASFAAAVAAKTSNLKR